MRLLLSNLILLLFSISVFAQSSAYVTGIVTDQSGMPLIGVTVFVKGTTSGTVTNIDGNYTLEALNDATLIYSFIGQETQEIPVNSQNSSCECSF